MAFQTEVFGGVGSILVESTGIEYYDIPAVTVVGRSNVAIQLEAVSNDSSTLVFHGR